MWSIYFKYGFKWFISKFSLAEIIIFMIFKDSLGAAFELPQALINSHLHSQTY